MSEKTIAERQITIRATPEKVFEAFSKPEHLVKWFCDGMDTEGGMFRFWGQRLLNATTPEQARQKLMSVEEPRRIEIDWPYGGGQTRLGFEVVAHPDGSLATIRHELLENTDDLKWWLAVDGILVALYNLRSYVESGVALLHFDLRKLGTTSYCDVTIQVPKDDVWAALTVPSEMNKWVSAEAKVDLREGGEYGYGWDEGGPGRILELEVGQKLVTSWSYDSEPETTAVWTVEGKGGQTTVTVTHSGFATPEQTEGYVQGWSAFLGALAALLEGREQARKAGLED